VPNQGGAERRAGAAPVEPGVRAGGGREQRRGGAGHRGGSGEGGLGVLDLALLVEVGLGQPAVQVEGVAGGREHGAAVHEAGRGLVHARAQAGEHGCEVPGVDDMAVGGLPADRLQASTVQEGRVQGTRSAERLVEPGDSGCRAREGAGEVGAAGQGGEVGEGRRRVEQDPLRFRQATGCRDRPSSPARPAQPLTLTRLQGKTSLFISGVP